MSGRIARNAAMLTGARGTALLLNLGVWVVLARVLEPERFGVIGFGLSVVSYFVLAVALGFDAVGSREAARDGGRLGELVGHLVAFRLALAAGATALYLTAVWTVPMPPLHRAVLTVLAVQIVTRAVQLDWVFVGIERMGAVAGREVLASALAAAGVVALVRSPDRTVLATAVVVAAPLVAALVMLAGYRRRFGPLRLRADRTEWARLLRPALPLAASALMIEVYTNLDRVMIEAFRTTEEVGWYTSAYKAVSLALVPASVLYQAFFPSVAAALGDRGAMRERAGQFARALAAVGVPVALAGPWLAEPAIVLVYGPAYAPAAGALAVLVGTAGLITLNMSLGMPLMAWDLERPYLRVVALGAVLNVALNLALIPTVGMVGAAWATLASEAAVGAGLARLYRRAVGGLPWRAVLRPVPAALAAGALAAWGTASGWPLLATLPASGALYLAVAVPTGAVDLRALRPTAGGGHDGARPS